MGDKQKILCCGDVEGRFNTLFNRIESIDKKSGPFDAVLCVGNFFGVNNKEFEAYKTNAKTVSVSTYVLGPNRPEHVDLYPEEGAELCPNVYYLGRRGLYTTSGGLKIAYLSGTAAEKQKQAHNFDLDDVVALRDACLRGNSSYRGVDVLITSQWPEGVTRFDEKFENTGLNSPTPLICWLSLQIRPRYIVGGSEGLFYERPPYRSHSISDDLALTIATRFLGLARVGNPNKARWLFALSLTPVAKMSVGELAQRTTDETECPFSLPELEQKLFKVGGRRPAGSGGSRQYFYDTNDYQEDRAEQGRRQKRQKIEFDQSKCWFCLASPAVEKHLVVTVGNRVYLALAKGGVIEEHFLICPVEHYQCANSLPCEVAEELDLFKEALRKFYARHNKVAVFFERNYKTSHMQIQAVPVPKRAAKDIKDIFKDEAEGHGLCLEELEECSRLDQAVKSGVPYFSVQLPGGEVLYTKIGKGKDFPLNFGREVLVSGPVLNTPDLADWRECVLGRETEDALVKRLRTDFEPYDITT